MAPERFELPTCITKLFLFVRGSKCVTGVIYLRVKRE